MRVALVQVRLDPKSNAANVEQLCAAIDRAAEGDPAPDLLVLPGACDTGGAAPRSGWRPAVLEGVLESIAWKAREWGVLVAAGLHVSHEETFVPCAALFDADGDIVARSAAAASRARSEAGAPAETWSSSVGDVGVLDPSVAGSGEERITTGVGGTLIAVPVCSAASGARRRAAEANIARLRQKPGPGRGLYWAVVTASGSPWANDAGGPGTFVTGPDGVLLASASDPGETIVYVDVPLGRP